LLWFIRASKYQVEFCPGNFPNVGRSLARATPYCPCAIFLPGQLGRGSIASRPPIQPLPARTGSVDLSQRPQGLPGQLATLTPVDRPASSLRRLHRTRFRRGGDAGTSAAVPDLGLPTGAVGVGFCRCLCFQVLPFVVLLLPISILVLLKLPLRREPHRPCILSRLHVLPKPVRSVSVSPCPSCRRSSPR
jgi:hypothetical protein